MRREYILSNAELIEFKWLQPFPGNALSFWKKVADVRGLDWRTVISAGQKFTALPLNHDKHWCYPAALKCKKKPAYSEA